MTGQTCLFVLSRLSVGRSLRTLLGRFDGRSFPRTTADRGVCGIRGPPCTQHVTERVVYLEAGNRCCSVKRTLNLVPKYHRNRTFHGQRDCSFLCDFALLRKKCKCPSSHTTVPSGPSDTAAAGGGKKSKIVYGKRKPAKSKQAAATPAAVDTPPPPPPPASATKPDATADKEEEEEEEAVPREGGGAKEEAEDAAADAADDWEDAVDDWDSADVTVSKRDLLVLLPCHCCTRSLPLKLFLRPTERASALLLVVPCAVGCAQFWSVGAAL